MKPVLITFVLVASALAQLGKNGSSPTGTVSGGGGGGGGGGTGTVTSVDATGGVQTESGSAITASGVIRASMQVNSQTGTTYTVLTGDRGKLVTLSNASSVAVTLPQAGGTFPSGWYAVLRNTGSGTVTVTPTTSTISGAASATLETGEWMLVTSDGANYQASSNRVTAGANVTVTKSSSGVQIAATSSSFAVQEVAVTVTSSELLNLFSTPKQLVAAPGAGKMINVLNYTLRYSYGTADYVNASGGALYLRIGTTAAATGSNVISLVTGFASALLGPVGSINNLTARQNMSDLENAPLQLAKVSGALTDGDGTLQIRVRYMIVDFP